MYFALWNLKTPLGTVEIETQTPELLSRGQAEQRFAGLLPKRFADWSAARGAGWTLQPRPIAPTHKAAKRQSAPGLRLADAMDVEEAVRNVLAVRR